MLSYLLKQVKPHKISINFGFTLAEVLITLGIIGVVAAMTIPTLIANSQKNAYAVALKKAYTIINQALVQIAYDNGCVGDLACTGLFDFSTTNQSLGSELVKYIKTSKDCGDYNVTNISGCFPDNVFYNYDGTNPDTAWDHGSAYRFITMDGISVLLNNYSDNCADIGWSAHVTNNMSKICADMYIDVNGPTKGPNSFGRDINVFYVTNGKGPLLYPSGGVDDATPGGGYWKPNGCSSTTSLIGGCCSGRIMDEGWQMNY